MTVQSLPQPGFKARHFRHDGVRHEGVVTTELDGNIIKTPEGILTLVIRSDATYATRHLLDTFASAHNELLQRAQAPVQSEADLKATLREHYQEWGSAIVAASVKSLDYEGKYDLAAPNGQPAHVHFHSADSLAGALIKGACTFVDKKYPAETPALFVSLDEMIDEKVFRENATRGTFQEIGFSRIFSLQGEEKGFVSRPGKESLETQIQHVRQAVENLQGASPRKVPVILLEDNIRRSKTINWVVEQMQKGSVFESGELAGVATCFSVATRHELDKISCNGQPVPVIIGMNYVNSIVDVVTPRDHLFDGLVVDYHNQRGRLPSFMIDWTHAAKFFKIKPDQASAFMHNVIDANIGFCEAVKQSTGVTPTLNAFVSGPMIAEVMGLSPETPMVDVLKSKSRGLHLVA